MSLALASVSPVSGCFLWRAIITQGGQVVGSTLVAGATRAQARAAALAIIARVSGSSS